MNNSYVNRTARELAEAEHQATVADELLDEATEALAQARAYLLHTNTHARLAEIAARDARYAFENAEEGDDRDELSDMWMAAENRVVSLDEDIEMGMSDMAHAGRNMIDAGDNAIEARRQVLEAINTHAQAHAQYLAQRYAMKEGGPSCAGG